MRQFFLLITLYYFCNAFILHTVERRYGLHLLSQYYRPQMTADSISDGDVNEKEKLRKALILLKENDEQWLKDVVGESTLTELLKEIDTATMSPIDTDRSPSKELSTPTSENISRKTRDYINVAPGTGESLKKSTKKTISINQRTLDKLFDLGYSRDEIILIKPDIIDAIIQKSVARPKKGLPAIWLKPFPASMDKAADGPEEQVDNRKTSRQSFKYKGKPLTTSEKTVQVNDKEEEDDNKYPSNSSQSDEALSFWPDLEEFKDMLVDESKFRVDTVGEWTIPFVKAETKWRYKVYKEWLNFLNKGLKTPFDDIEDGFYDDEIEEDILEDASIVSDDLEQDRKDVKIVNRSPMRRSNIDPEDESTLTRSRTSPQRPRRDSEDVRRDTENSKAELYQKFMEEQMRKTSDWVDIEEAEQEAKELLGIRSRRSQRDSREDENPSREWFYDVDAEESDEEEPSRFDKSYLDDKEIDRPNTKPTNRPEPSRRDVNTNQKASKQPQKARQDSYYSESDDY